MVQQLLQETPPNDKSKKRRRAEPNDTAMENVISKLSSHVQAESTQPCAESGCPALASSRKPAKAELRGYCEVHRHLRAFLLNGPLVPDRSAAAKLFRTKREIGCFDITPGLAIALLERNLNNRRLDAGRVEMYARDMTNGDWQLNNQGIALGADGLLHDGQHRLWAVVKSGCTVPMLVVVGLSAEARPTIDQGRSRTVGDALQIFDQQPSGTRVVSWLRAIETLNTNRDTPLSHAVARRELWRFESSVTWFLSNGPKAPYGRAAVVGALIYAHAVEPEHVECFTKRYVSGANLEEGSPALALRNYVAERVFRGVDSSRAISLKTLKCVLADQMEEPIQRLAAAEDSFEHYRQRHRSLAS